MNTARNRNASRDLLALAERSTEELIQMLGRRDPARPSRYLHSAKVRRHIEHVLRVRQIMGLRGLV